MFPAGVILKIMLVEFIKSPRQTLADITRRFLPQDDMASHIMRMRERAHETPLILQVETTNACNANCVFCAYPTMQRAKGIMSLPMFEQIVNEYASMGGGPVSLTPLVGDALLDPHLLERLKILDACPQVRQVTMTTNAIAFERFSDDEICQILKVMDCIQVSVGGLDPETYKSLFGVDRYEQVRKGMDRLLTIRNEVASPVNINFAFRTDDWKFELRYWRQLHNYRKRGAYISHIWTYANYSGLIQKKNTKQKLEVIESGTKKPQTCIYPAVHMAIGWDGKITACGCVDFEGKALNIGQIGEESLKQVWFGKKRRAILDSFSEGKLAKICFDCSAYKPDSDLFSRMFCREINPSARLPPEFFQQFWGG